MGNLIFLLLGGVTLLAAVSALSAAARRQRTTLRDAQRRLGVPVRTLEGECRLTARIG